MAPETRSQDIRRLDDSLEAVHRRINGMEARLDAQSDDLTQIKAMVKEMATQQIAIKQTLQTLLDEASSSQKPSSLQHPATAIDALCCRFGGRKDPLEELKEHKQEGNLSLQHPATAIDALCCRFGGQKDPLEELKEHKQENLEKYIGLLPTRGGNIRSNIPVMIVIFMAHVGLLDSVIHRAY